MITSSWGILYLLIDFQANSRRMYNVRIMEMLTQHEFRSMPEISNELNRNRKYLLHPILIYYYIAKHYIVTPTINRLLSINIR